MATDAEKRGVSTTYNVLFVCTGNTCRSPMAEALARREVRERRWSHVAVRSAGISAHPGGAASEGALQAARERGLKVIPICPFFAAYIQKHGEEQDLLDASWRTRFGLPPL